jgi:hypothetical protein
MKRWRLHIAAAFVLFTVMPAGAQSATKAGLLSCNMGPTIGMIVGSHQHIHCRFTPDAGGPSELYSGSITRIGLDVGFRAGGALRGHYVGASGDASFGLGAGGKLLVGGSHKTISLQPLALSGQVGVNLALGVAGLTLR